MRLADIMGALSDPAPAAWRSAASLDLRGVTADSRQVEEGFLFAALPGAANDGYRFIADAVARGAAAVLAPDGASWPDGVPFRPMLRDPAPRRRLAQIAACLAGSQPDAIVAITGTNGKTSTAEFLRQLWALSGLKAASLGTLGLVAPGFAAGPGLTTPDPVALSATLRQLAEADVQHAAIEASSHGLNQFRLDGVRLAAAAFTNLTRDHLDYHGTLDAYRRAKLRLFTELLPRDAPAVFSTTLDAETRAALTTVAAERRLALRSVGEDGDAIRLTRVTPRPDGQALELLVGGVRHDVLLRLPGRFQVDNALLAAALAQTTDLPDPISLLPRLTGVRGRMELAATLQNGAAVYVDFAHTSDALERLLTALRPHTEGRLHIVFGAGGDRDPGKRPLMGAAASRLADQAIVTDDNPRTENAAFIRAQVLAGCRGGVEIGDRAEAIAAGLAALAPGDVLVVAGKGHEQGQTIGSTTIPFDDVATVRRLAGLE
jgi:UDP-N-acetylmuramoyl-L-alanyl-D-glutamate--2,6-diaminopimelate ligase